MIYSIVPCRRGEHINKIVPALLAQGSRVVVVRDRCKVDITTGCDVVDSDYGDGFMAGYCRDIGLDFAMGRADFDGAIFVDEDCIPQNGLVAAHTAALMHSFPVISIGRRLEYSLGWHDSRELGEAGNWKLFSGKGTVVQNVSWVVKCLAAWSCNMGINRHAVRIIRNAMHGFCGAYRLFSPAFDGKWGGEDAFLSYLAWAYRVPMAYLPHGANAVKHMDHPRPEPEYGKGFAERLDAEVDKLKRYCAVHPLCLDDMV